MFNVSTTKNQKCYTIIGSKQEKVAGIKKYALFD
jgi:hypothetical protein